MKSRWYEEQGLSLVSLFWSRFRKRNYTIDGVDKYEENLCLLDVEIRGVIVDDGINAGNVRSLPRGGRFHAIGEAYHAYGIAELLGIPYCLNEAPFFRRTSGEYSKIENLQGRTSDIPAARRQIQGWRLCSRRAGNSFSSPHRLLANYWRAAFHGAGEGHGRDDGVQGLSKDSSRENEQVSI